jgi:hypothetical protein
MKPAFAKITIKKQSDAFPNGQLTVEGPIDLDGKELDAYFWVRVSKDDSAEAVGNDEMSKRQLGGALKKAVAVGVAAGAPPDPMWRATIPIEEPSFARGDVVKIEAWARVTTDQPKRTFNVYWEEEEFTIE